MVLVRAALLKVMVILVATLCERLIKVTMPATAVRLVVPWRVPLPVPLVRAALTTVLLLLVQRLPNWSYTRMTGC